MRWSHDADVQDVSSALESWVLLDMIEVFCKLCLQFRLSEDLLSFLPGDMCSDSWHLPLIGVSHRCRRQGGVSSVDHLAGWDWQMMVDPRVG
ncbi:hypothetical protein ES702_05930 [subsurface metagenome]